MKPMAFKSSGALGSALKKATATLSVKLDDAGVALCPAKVDVIVVRKKRFEVPRGRRVSERMWTAFTNTGNRKVTFSPVVEAKLVPSKEECYPTPRYKAACFFSKYHADTETRSIAPGGAGRAEWLTLLSETRQATAEGRKQQQQEHRQLCTDHDDAARQVIRGLDQAQEERTAVRQVEVKHGDGNDSGFAGGSVSEAGMALETGSWGCRRLGVLSVDEKIENMGLLRAAKAFGRWVERFCRVPWTPGNGGVDSCWDWVVEFPAGLEHDVV
eukprot:g2406.t1